MRSVLSVLVFGAIFNVLFARGESGTKRTLRYTLDPQNPTYVIPVNPWVNVTVQFPSVIQDLNGRGFTMDASKVSGAYEVWWVQGTSYFTITPFSRDANGEHIEPQVRNLNAICYGMPFSIICKPVEDPDNAPTIVLFEAGEQLAEQMQGEQPPPYVKRSQSLPESRLVSSGAAAIINGVDVMKMLLAMPDAKALADALAQLNSKAPPEMPNYLFSQRDGPRKKSEFDFQTHKIHLTHVLRVDRRDLMIFNLRITNTSKQQILLDSESFRVRSGDQVYDQVTVDIAPLIAPGQTVEGQVAVIGSPTGDPNNLKPDNEFFVSVDLINAAVVSGEMPAKFAAIKDNPKKQVPPSQAKPQTPTKPTPVPTPTPTPSPSVTPMPTPTPALKPIPQDPKKPVDPPEEIRRALPLPVTPFLAPDNVKSAVPTQSPSPATTPASFPPGKALDAGKSVPIDDQISIQIE